MESTPILSVDEMYNLAIEAYKHCKQSVMTTVLMKYKSTPMDRALRYVSQADAILFATLNGVGWWTEYILP